MLYVFATLEEIVPITVIVSLISSILGYINAQYIINGGVYSDGDTSIIIQSLPIHYMFMAFATFMIIITLYSVIVLAKNALSTKQTSFMTGWQDN